MGTSARLRVLCAVRMRNRDRKAAKATVHTLKSEELMAKVMEVKHDTL